MTRILLTLAVAFATATAARAEILPSFSMGHCETEASHVVVVDRTGKVLESWRGDLKPGDRLPIDEFHLKFEQDVGRFGKVEGGPEKVSGDRLVLFLRKGGSRYGRGRVVGSWAPANAFGLFDISTLWVEGGRAFALEQFSNPGPLALEHYGTEADAKKRVEGINRAVADAFAKARAETKLAERAKILARTALDYPGFAADALAGLEWCGADAVPALRSIVDDPKGSVGEPTLVGVYATLAKIGAPARDVLMKHLSDQLKWWKESSEKVGNWGKLDENEERSYRTLRAATENPEAFQNLTPDQLKTLRQLRDLWATHEVLSKLGEKGDRIADRLDRVLPRAKE